MAFSNSIHHLHGASTYAYADKVFKAAPVPKAVGQTAKWGINARPLDDLKKWHYRIERGGVTDGEADYYDVCLYHTKMARYYKPEPDGTEVRLYTWHDSKTSSRFLHRIIGVNQEQEYLTTDGRTVLVPIHYNGHPDITGREFSTKVVLTPDRRLIQARSLHMPVYKPKSSPEALVWRKALRANLSTLAMLFEMRVAEYEREWGPQGSKWRHPGKPFSKNAAVETAMKRLRTHHYYGSELMKPELAEDSVEALRLLHEACCDSTLERRDYAGNVGAPLMPREITKAWYRKLDELMPFHIRSATTRIPDFPEVLPKNYTFRA